MLALYRCLLHLYPDDYFREYAEEMASVFGSAQEAARHRNFRARALFCAREISGVVTGALRERFGSRDWDFGRFEMRTEFRFPRSTICLMLVILVGVLLAIEKGRSISQLKSSALPDITIPWSTLPGFFLMALALMCVSGAVGYGIIVLLGRSGVSRLSNVQTWPQRK